MTACNLRPAAGEPFHGAVFNSANDSGLIGVNGLDQTSGQTVLDAGTYTDVTINTEGQGWTITIDPGT